MPRFSLAQMRGLLVLAVIAAAYFLQPQDGSIAPAGSGSARGSGSSPRSGSAPQAMGAAERRANDDAILRAYQAQLNDVLVEGEGTVEKVLRDDEKGSRHQRFLLVLDSGHSLLFAHNIDLAPRIPNLRRGDRIQFKGEYEWNERGGVVHWTHHDPRNRHPGGWLRRGTETFD